MSSPAGRPWANSSAKLYHSVYLGVSLTMFARYSGADMLHVFPWHPVSSIYVSDTSLTPTRCITCSRTRCPPAHTHRRSLEPHARRTQHPPAVFHLHSAAAPKSLRIESVLSTEPSRQVYMRASSVARNLPCRAVHANRGGRGRRIAFPLPVHPRAHVLVATPSRLRVCAYPVVFASSRIVGYCQCVSSVSV
jgi:hypothetical protein